MCAGEVIYFSDEGEVKATPKSVKRQILANNLAVDKCREIEMGSTQKPPKQDETETQRTTDKK